MLNTEAGSGLLPTDAAEGTRKPLESEPLGERPFHTWGPLVLTLLGAAVNQLHWYPPAARPSLTVVAILVLFAAIAWISAVWKHYGAVMRVIALLVLLFAYWQVLGRLFSPYLDALSRPASLPTPVEVEQRPLLIDPKHLR